MRALVAAVAVGLLAGCAATRTYIGPQDGPAISNSKVVDRPRAQVWDAVIPELAKSFFVINTVDRSSGLINVSYSGNPLSYVDCGKVVIDNPTPQQSRVEFDAATPSVSYEALAWVGLIPIRGMIDRSMSLEGRINLVFEDAGEAKTRVTANVQYLLTRRISVLTVQGGTSQRTDVVNFTSRVPGSFVPFGPNPPVQCRATGEIERTLLALTR